MNYRQLSLFWAIAAVSALALSASAAACDGELWVEFQVRTTQINTLEAAERISVDRAGCVLSTYPSFDRRSGRFTRQLSPIELDELREALDKTDLDQVVSAIEAPVSAEREGAPELWTISHSDLHSLTVHQGAASERLDWKTEEVEAPIISNRNAIIGLKEVVALLRELAADPLRQDVIEVSE